MKQRLAIFCLAVVMAVSTGIGRAQETQDNKAKEASRTAAMSQVVDATSQTQSDAGGRVEDQLVAYRFYLAPMDFGTDLIITNPTDQPGLFTIIAREREGRSRDAVKRSVAPGETFALLSHDESFVLSDLAYIKASRRLRLGFRFPGEAEPSVIPLDPGAARYEVFSAERQSEVSFSRGLRQIELLSAGRILSKKLAEDAAPQAAVSELSEQAGGAGARTLFVAHSAK